MAWTEINRRKNRREHLRYASDMTDDEWEILAQLLPAKYRWRRPRTTDLRDVMNAIFYVAETGCQWGMLPKDFLPFTTVQSHFYQWRDYGRWQTINHCLLMEAREATGWEASSSAEVMHGQSVLSLRQGAKMKNGIARKNLLHHQNTIGEKSFPEFGAKLEADKHV